MDHGHLVLLIPALRVSVGAFALFAGIAWAARGEGPLPRLDGVLARQLRGSSSRMPRLTFCFLHLSRFGSPRAVRSFTLGLAVLLVGLGQYWLSAMCLMAGIGGKLVEHELKTLFRRPRPPFAGPTAVWSFPSGHAMGASIIYGLLAYLLTIWLPWEWAGWVAVAGLSVLVLAIGFSRLYLGQHYLSDVLGGFSAGGGWLGSSVLVVETLRRAWERVG